MLEDGSTGWVALILSAAFFSSLILVRLYLYIAPAIGAVAKPTDRGSHRRPTPTGAGIILLFVVGLILFVFGRPDNFYAFFISAALISILGFIDDIRPIPLLLRLVLQIGFVMPVVSNEKPNNLVEFLGEPGASVLIALIIVVFINIFNFMDGSDGMAGLSGLLVMLAWAFIGEYSGEYSIALLSLGVSGALMGFLIFNWHPARVFLGDAGSTLIGFAAAAIPLVTSQRSIEHPPIPIWPIMLFPWIFVFDALFNRSKRLISGSRFWEPNRDHFYQRLVDSGTGHASVAIFYGSMTTVMIFTTLGAVLFGGFFYLILLSAAVIMPVLLIFTTGKKGIDLNT